MIKPIAGRAEVSGRDPTLDDAGQRLKRVRESLNLRYRDVEEASLRIAARHKNDEYSIALSRLSDIENKGTVPSIYRLYTLCAIYHLDFLQVLAWYGLNFSSIGADASCIQIERTHIANFTTNLNDEVTIPISLDPGIDLRRTVFLSRMIERWGRLPLVLLNAGDVKNQRYGYVGTEDWFMDPLIQPGSLLLIDETKRKIAASGWTSEFDRPIYFIEHRLGYSCCWCSPQGDRIICQPHHASSCSPEIHALDAVDVIGQVCGIAMRLDPLRKRRNRS